MDIATRHRLSLPEWGVMLWGAAVFVFLALGLLIRMRWYLASRSLWLDECFVAWNLLTRSYVGLSAPLDADQVFPIGLLWMIKAFCEGFGYEELTLRYVPFVVSITGVSVCALLFWRILPPSGAAIAVLLMAFGQTLIHYSNELKPYGSDVFVAATVLLMGVRVVRRDITRPSIVMLGLAGALLVWFSSVAAILLGAVGLTVFAKAVVERKKHDVLLLLVLAVMWLASIATCWSLHLSRFTTMDYFYEYVREGFPPSSWQIWRTASWVERMYSGMFVRVLAVGVPGLAAFLFAAGVCHALRTSRWVAAVVFCPLVVLLGMSIAGVYPFLYSNGRTSLFLAPTLCVGVAAGAGWVLRRGGHLLYAMTVMLLVFPALRSATWYWRTPKEVEEFRPVYRTLMDRYTAGDLVYVYPEAISAYKVYTRLEGWAPGHVVLGRASGRDGRDLAAELSAMPFAPRFWMLFSHYYEGYLDPHETWLRQSGGRVVERFVKPGAELWLCERSVAHE